MLEESFHAIFNKSTSRIDNVAFSVPIEATRVLKDRQLSTSYKSVMGGAHPNHLISVEGKTKVEVLSIIENDKMVMEEDIKNFSNQSAACVCGILPLWCIVWEATDKKNDSNDFNNKIFETCKKYSNNHPGRSYTTFCS